MDFIINNGIPTIAFDSIGTVALALLMMLLGQKIKNRIKFFQNYCIPAPVIGGVLFAMVNLLVYSRGILMIETTSTYQTDMQNLFFTCVGFGISISLLKKGGGRLIKYFLMTTVLIIIQAVVSVVAAKMSGLDIALAVMAGPAPLAGGHGNAAAYGKLLVEMGHIGADSVGMAAATFGLITGSFFGGPICNRLIMKYNLVNNNRDNDTMLDNVNNVSDSKNQAITVPVIFYHVAIIATLVTFGSLISKLVNNLWGISIPTFAGAALMASVIGNINERKKWININNNLMEYFQDFTLGLFLSMAMISLKLWQLASLAVPMMVTLLAGLIATILFIYFVVFRVCGKDFDSAVMCAGMTGHGMGATPNGLANMDSVSQKYGTSKIAYLCVIVTGGILADWVLLVVNTTMVNLFG